MAKKHKYETLYCVTCNRMKALYMFSEDMQKSNPRKCKVCEATREDMYGGFLPPILKTRKCINCGEDFISVNDLRMCDKCKDRLIKDVYDDDVYGSY